MTEHDEAKGGTRDPDDVPGSLTLSGILDIHDIGFRRFARRGVFAETGCKPRLVMFCLFLVFVNKS